MAIVIHKPMLADKIPSAVVHISCIEAKAFVASTGMLKMVRTCDVAECFSLRRFRHTPLILSIQLGAFQVYRAPKTSDLHYQDC